MKESDLQRKIKARLEREFPGSFWTKIHGGPHQQAGLPDLVGCVMGRLIGLEIKLPGKEGTMTPRQTEVLAKLTAAGATASMVTNEDDAVLIVRGGTRAIETDWEPWRKSS